MIDRAPVPSPPAPNSPGTRSPIISSPNSSTILLSGTPTTFLTTIRHTTTSRSDGSHQGVIDHRPQQQEQYLQPQPQQQQQQQQQQQLRPPQTISMPSNEELVAICHAFIERMRKRVAPWVIHRMNETYGPVPDDPAKLSFWMALVGSIPNENKKCSPIFVNVCSPLSLFSYCPSGSSG